MPQEKSLPADLEKFRQTYIELFGEMPPLPAAKFEFGAEVDAEAVRLGEQYRAHAFYNKSFDAKTTQLLIFGMLLATEAEAAKFHAQAAQRAGASWQELFAVAELASAVVSLGPVNQASAMLKELRGKEKGEA